MKTWMKSLLAGVVLAAGALTPALAAGPTVTIGINSLTAIYWPTYVARAKGFYTKNGIEADIIMTGSPVKGVQQLIGGSLDIAHPTLYTAVNALAQGAKFTLVGCIVNTLPYSMVARPEVRSAADLAGKTVMLAFKSDLQTLMWRDWLKSKGVDPAGVDQIYDPQAANRYAALATKNASVSLLNAPFDLRAAAEGNHVLMEFGPLSQGYAMAVVATRPDYLQSNPAEVRAYLKATQEAIDWLYDPANRAEAIAILARDTKQDAAIAAATYDDYVLHQKPYDRLLDLPDAFLQRTLDSAIELGDAQKGQTPGVVKDLSYRPN